MYNLLDLSDDSLATELLTAPNKINFFIQAFPGNFYWYDKNGTILGCNDNQAIALGFRTNKDLIGLNVYDFIQNNFSDTEIVNVLKKNNNYIIESGKTATFEEAVFYQGQKKVFLTKKAPLRDSNDEIIGIIGLSFDITEQKEAERLKTEMVRQEVERLNLENAMHKKMLQEQEKFKKIAFQVAHDITSPVIALTMFTETYADELPEDLRYFLKTSATRINDIAYNLLNQYKSQATVAPVTDEEPEDLLLSSTLLKMLAEKKLQYAGLSVRFDFIAQKKDYFAFINIQPNAFKRSLSNIINNAVDAFDQQAGTVTLKLDADNQFANITIEDNGKGMPEAVKHKIMTKLEVTSGKADGHGIGMGQVRDTLANNKGKLEINSEVGKGTKITLIFPRIASPDWIADKIVLLPKMTILVLDDEPSIHGAWDKRFGVDAPNIPIRHFTQGQEVIDYVNGLSAEQKENLFLLTDYELLKQEVNGLQVIEKTGLKRSILVTSHYENEEVRKLAAKISTKILPKPLASEVPIVLTKSAEGESYESTSENRWQKFFKSLVNFK